MLSVGLKSNSRRWYRSGYKTEELCLSPPAFDMLGSTYERDHARWEGEEGRCLRVSLPPHVLQRHFPDDSTQFDMETRFENIDYPLRNTILALAAEMRAGFPNGEMYAEGLSWAALGWLHANYRKVQKVFKREQTLTRSKQQRIIDFIEASIDSTISVDQLAALVNISPSHFFPLFRRVFGVTPYQYVMKKRIERVACILKTEPDRSLSEIALATGFSNQAHMINVFKRFKHQTPLRWKLSNL